MLSLKTDSQIITVATIVTAIKSTVLHSWEQLLKIDGAPVKSKYGAARKASWNIYRVTGGACHQADPPRASSFVFGWTL